MLIEQLFNEVAQRLDVSVLSESDKILLVRGYVAGSLNQAKNSVENEQEMDHIGKVFLGK